jgi:hypothetical protein
MTDSLKRFTDALAQSYDGTSPTPAASRARVMRALRSRSLARRRWLPWFVVPLLTLGAGTALAASGHLPKLVAQVATWLDGDRKVTDAEAALQKAPPQHFTRSPASSQNETLTEPLPIPSATAAGEEEAVVGKLAPPEDGTPGGGVTSRSPKRSSRGASLRAPFSEKTALVKEAATPAPVGTANESLALYKEAQQTHFRRGDCATAVGLYSRYLATFPSGQFTLEAKYNQGICFLRLGRTDEARRALEPFAQGRFGGYRQAEAKALLGTTGK